MQWWDHGDRVNLQLVPSLVLSLINGEDVYNGEYLETMMPTMMILEKHSHYSGQVVIRRIGAMQENTEGCFGEFRGLT